MYTMHIPPSNLQPHTYISLQAAQKGTNKRKKKKKKSQKSTETNHRVRTVSRSKDTGWAVPTVWWGTIGLLCDGEGDEPGSL